MAGRMERGQCRGYPEETALVLRRPGTLRQRVPPQGQEENEEEKKEQLQDSRVSSKAGLRRVSSLRGKAKDPKEAVSSVVGLTLQTASKEVGKGKGYGKPSVRASEESA